MSKAYWKRQNLVQIKTDVQNLETILRIQTLVFNLDFFRNYETFSKVFLLHQRVPFIFLKFCNRMDVKKSQRVLDIFRAFYIFRVFCIFRHCDTVQNSQFSFFFENFLMSPKGSSFIFSHTLQQTGVSKSPKGPLLQF